MKLASVSALFLLTAALLNAQAPPAAPAPAKETLRFVAIVSRHGVRSPTGKTDQLNLYSRLPWPAWSVPPGYLTAHGAQLISILASYDRAQLATEGLLAPTGCDDATRIALVSDSDQRTRETARAFAAGFAPGCNVAVRAQEIGTEDPLFHPLSAGLGHPDKALAAAAILGRIGGKPESLPLALRPQLEALARVLDPCTGPACPQPRPQSLFDIPSTLTAGKGDHLAELRSPLSLAATMSENLLLEYAEGMPEVGWGRVDLANLRFLLDLHTAGEEFGNRTPPIARAQASNLLSHLLATLEQAAQSKPVPGALTAPDAKLLFLSGHDTNLASIAGLLNLSWIADGRRDDTPPGSALIFELWQQPSGADRVRLYYQAQTLDQMRTAAQLTLANPPDRAPLYIPACSQTDLACPLEELARALRQDIDPAFVR